MMEKMDIDLPDEFLQKSKKEEIPQRERHESFYSPCQRFDLPKSGNKTYEQQYGDIYFMRLAMLKPAVELLAAEAWSELEIAGEKVHHVDRVLDVRQGELCWITGTIYMDMPLKPNVLEDLAKDLWLAAPPPPREKYLSPDGQDLIVLEDESGRLRLIGAQLELCLLVTGCIVSVVGTENADGEFEVVDIKIPDLPRQPQRWEREEAASVLRHGNAKQHEQTLAKRKKDGKVAIISGLRMSSAEGDMLQTDMLMEFLLGEAGGTATRSESARISRLIIAGDSIREGNPLRPEGSSALASDTTAPITSKRAAKKYGYDASVYNPLPIKRFDDFLATLLPTIPITLLPGAEDPANVSLPQQPLHLAMLPRSRNYTAVANADTKVSTDGSQMDEPPDWFHSTSNPWEGDIEGWRFMGHSGQPVDDMFKYVEGEDRLDMIEALLRWRCIAPTAPDTLCCYPYQDTDPFVITECPHLFFVGNQAAFETTEIEGPTGQIVRIVTIPRFKETGEIVLVDTETLEVELMRFDVWNDN